MSTIGYEKADIHAFCNALAGAGVQTLIDVRDVAVSRRKGFSKRALSDHLSQVGIEYVHLRGLGDPKEGREAARRGDFKTFRKVFGKHLETERAQADLASAKEILDQKHGCLMCYERSPIDCHRLIVAKQLAGDDYFDIQHLSVPLKVIKHSDVPSHRSRQRKGSDPCESAPSCG
ncbi:MAG: DUF488 family protein [Magnetovibrionaceae bacterium]